MGWAKYYEDNVSRFWRDANTQVRFPKDDIGRPAQPPDVPARHRLSGKQDKMKEFTIVKARPLPVILLADVSGSMSSDGKIETLNSSIREMIATFGNEDELRAEIQLGIITFGGTKAKAQHPLTQASTLNWGDLKATGKTPLGAALAMATEWLESREIIPSRAYAPTLILVSDGQPTDEWKQALDNLLKSPRAQKAQRLALAIGADADEEVLKAFLANPEVPVLHANDASQISKFFRFVTMSVCSRLASADPNQPVLVATFDLDNFEGF